MNRNSSRVYIFKMTDGTVVFEKGRNSFGAYLNAVDRVEARTGKKVDVQATAAMTDAERDAEWKVA